MTTMTKTPHARREHGLAEKRNVGGWERVVRLFFGATAIGAAFAVGPVWLAVLLGLIGAEGMITSVEGYCPLNQAVGRDSYHRRHPDLR
jgi:hypothetical protein